MPVVDPAQALSLVPDRGHVDRDAPVRHATCRDTCAIDAATAWHHARLTRVEDDQDALLELFELAITWHELDYNESAVIPPDRWTAVVEDHRWTDQDRVDRIFRIATDVLTTAARARGRRLTVDVGHEPATLRE